jgi:hypothetical protein
VLRTFVQLGVGGSCEGLEDETVALLTAIDEDHLMRKRERQKGALELRMLYKL